ncbi:MAG: hypothetical protein LBD02_02815 [Christensenellaceae bacterium]|nr:hypothetical protein [Christensenellaceae bacterium]
MELGRAICDTYYEGCESIGQADAATLSVVDLSKTPALLQAYDAAGVEALMLVGFDPSYISSFGRATRSAENYGGNNTSEGYTNMVDVGDLIRKSSAASLLPSNDEALVSALDGAVYYQVKWHRSRGFGAIVIYERGLGSDLFLAQQANAPAQQ